MTNIAKSLTSLPATDGNFLSALSRATKEDLECAIYEMENSNGQHKSRIAACKKELKKKSDILFLLKEAEEMEDISDKVGEQFYDFFEEADNYTTDIGIYIMRTLRKCKTKAELEVADRMITAICGYSFASILTEIKKKDVENYCWKSVC